MYFVDNAPPAHAVLEIENRIREKNDRNQPLRDAVARELRRTEILEQAKKALPDVIRHLANRAVLEDAGIRLPEESWNSFVRLDASPEDRARADQLVGRQINRLFDDAVTPAAQAAALEILKEFAADVAAFSATTAVIAKYGFGQHPLELALKSGIENLRNASIQKLDTSYHYSIAIAVNRALFSEGAPVDLNPPAPAAAASIQPPTGSLRTAADVAESRAA